MSNGDLTRDAGNRHHFQVVNGKLVERPDREEPEFEDDLTFGDEEDS